MPTFLNDEDDNSRVYSNNADIVSFGSGEKFGLAEDADKDRVNGDQDPRHIHQSGPIHEIFDESSTASTHDSEFSDTTPMPANESATQQLGVTSAPNGTAVPRPDDAQDGDWQGSIKEKALPNGTAAFSTTLPDGTTPLRRQSTGTAKSNSNGMELHHSMPPPRSSTDSLRKPLRRSADAVQPPLQTIPSEPEPADRISQTLSFTPATPLADSPQHRISPHRLSSPPIYQSGYSTFSGSSSALQPAATPALRQRHTLEVPKLSPQRISRDEFDTAQASGRFSPTVAGMGQRRASLTLVRRTTRSMMSDPPRDEVVPDEDAMRWAEAYRQKRASKRKRREEVDDDRVLVGTKVDESHANWVTAYNMLTGIRVSVSRTNAKLDRDVTDADFEVKQKSTFDIAGNEMVPSAKYDFKFKDYAPWIFRRLRGLFRLDPADYLMSLTGKYILSELGSPGKSGSFFYFSRDYKYIIKTIHHSEHKFLRKVLKDYYQHVQDNPNTLLSQFYGLHRVKMPYGKKIHFVVMNNLFPPHRDIHSTFDLKGSTFGRLYKEEDLEKNPRATMKDLNWLRRQRHLELGIQKKQLFLEQLQRDVVLLKRLQIMDYSLLVGVHDISRGNEENLRDKTLQVFNPGGERPSEGEPSTMLLRTPSKLENARKARELRQMIRHERPVPMGQALDKMPDELGEGHSRRDFLFNQDDGGFQATHDDNSPADEVYYLGVIDCLTRYGMIKKIEHFWKGLSHDRTQISALPPEQYGDRFYNFIEGVTMSPEEIEREREREREQEAAERVSGTERAPSRTARRKSLHHIPPMPNHQPPAPPSGQRSPEGREVIEMASGEARKTEMHGATEKQVPERTLKTTGPGEPRNSLQHEPILPVVEEDRETIEGRPRTPPKDDKMLPPTRAPPPTPPKNAVQLTPQSSDSGYGDNSNGTLSRDNSFKVHHGMGRGTLNKSLPPLPKKEGTEDSGVRMGV